MFEGAVQTGALLILSALLFVWQDFWVVTALLLQILLPAAACCLAIHYARRLLMRQIASAFGWTGVLAVSWLGTPIHELSHVFALLLTGVKVTKLALFEPNRETGGLGYVKFSYAPRNPLHQLGCFLSSLAPLVGGSVAIYGVTVLLLPGFSLHQGVSGVPFFQPADVMDWQRAGMALERVADFEMAILRQLASGLSLSDWRTYAYVYFVFSVAHNMSPSAQDLVGFPKRIGFLLVALLILNAPLLLMGYGDGRFYGETLLPPVTAAVAGVTSFLYLGVLVSWAAVFASLPITALARALRG